MFARRRFLRHSLAAGVAVVASEISADEATVANSPAVRIIDAHCHAGKGTNYRTSDPQAAPWTTFNDPERVLRQSVAAGISRTIIFPITNGTYEKANEEIASYVKKWPDKFIGFAKHDPKTEGGQIRDLLRHEVRELGLKGLKLHVVPTEEMLVAAEELRIPILVHPPKVADLIEVVRVWPRINFILAHLGNFASRDWKEHLRGIEAAKTLPNLYLETSAVVFQEFLELAVREVPAEKLIFGTDGPLVDQRVEVHKLELIEMPLEQRQKIMGDNILRLLAG